MISEIENLTWVIMHQWQYVTDEVRALSDGGRRAEDGAEALAAEYGMTAEEAGNAILGLEALEALKWIRERAASIEEWVKGWSE